jgi:hypothetical protein
MFFLMYTCCRFFSPLGMVPVVALAGLGLFERGFPVVKALVFACTIRTYVSYP